MRHDRKRGSTALRETRRKTSSKGVAASLTSGWPGNAQGEITNFGKLTRGQLMARVRSKGNATTEKRLAKLLRKAGLQGWRSHQPLIGKPDFAWRTAKLAVFVNGCFWHGHRCGKNINPKINAAAWLEKLTKNRARDRRVNAELRKSGWTVVRIWECALRRDPERCIERIRRGFHQSL
jgi:DNA mismatch endonuclease (patch repair protein)